jgi:MarC family membrane protein
MYLWQLRLYLGGLVSVLSAALLLLLVIDPFGNIPVFLAVLKGIEEPRRTRVIARELCIALVVLVVFLLAGRHILRLLQVSQESLRIAGGTVLFLIALKMIFRGSEAVFEGSYSGEPFVVPLAVPLVAGPSATATVILLSAREPAHWPQQLLALACAWAVSAVILLASSVLSRLLGQKGLSALERLMGMILTVVAVEMLLGGLREYLLR